MKALWEELHSHRPLPNCTCPHQCRCVALRVTKERVEDQIIQFLTGLNDQFSVVKTQVLLLDPLPSLNKVFSLVIQEESNNVSAPSLPSIEDSSVLVNASDARRLQGRGKGLFNKPSHRFFTFCNRYNHTIEFCYQKHGFPTVNKTHSQANATTTEPSDASNISSSTGLAQDKIDQLVLLLQQANLVSSGSNPPFGQPTNHISVSPQITFGYTASSSSAGIFNVNSSSLPSNSLWPIDSRANEHIFSNLSHFTSFYQIKPVHVTLPNGSSLIVDHAGTISFSPQFYLTNVLYSPNFKLNLISVAKLCESLSCVFHFKYDKCLIQDKTSFKMIGLASQQDGLYKFHVSNLASVNSISSKINVPCTISAITCNSNTSIPIKALWHFRLGHLSHQRMDKVSSLYSSITNDNKATCDICHFAKQHHIPFTSSLSHASSNFELLHLDIWGPLSISYVHGHKYFLTIVDDHSRFLWTILLKTKVEVSHHAQSFIKMIQNQFHVTPKFVRSDNGHEFMLSYFYASLGIIHHKSCVETPQ